MFSKRHYALLANGPKDTSADIAARKRRAAILLLVQGEVVQRWPSIDASNVQDALAYQDRRIEELGR